MFSSFFPLNYLLLLLPPPPFSLWVAGFVSNYDMHAGTSNDALLTAPPAGFCCASALLSSHQRVKMFVTNRCVWGRLEGELMFFTFVAGSFGIFLDFLFYIWTVIDLTRLTQLTRTTSWHHSTFPGKYDVQPQSCTRKRGLALTLKRTMGTGGGKEDRVTSNRFDWISRSANQMSIKFQWEKVK